MSIIITAPMPWKQALDYTQAKTLLPTSLGSRDLLEMEPAILERARFSAKVRSAEHLSILDDGTNAAVAGKVDHATVRLQLKQFLARSGYKPAEGKKGTIEDLSSDLRTDLQIRMNVKMAQGYGWWKQGQDPDLLDAYPAREFLRIEDRKQPRTDWPKRWNDARAATITDGATDSSTGVMAALVGHPIWKKLNVFGHEYEPFDWGSGYGTEDVDRARAIALELIGRDTQIFPQDIPFNADFKASPEIRNARMRKLLEATGVGHYDQDGVFVLNTKGGE